MLAQQKPTAIPGLTMPPLGTEVAALTTQNGAQRVAEVEAMIRYAKIGLMETQREIEHYGGYNVGQYVENRHIKATALAALVESAIERLRARQTIILNLEAKLAAIYAGL